MSSTSQNPSGGGVNIAVAVGVPIVIVIVTVVIILVLILGFLYYRSRQRKKEAEDKGAYAPLPTQDDSSARTPTPSPPLKTKSPFGTPQSISIGDPPTPSMQFTMATQLGDSSKSGLRYPFMEPHKHPEGRNLRDTRPPKQRTKKKGNHKHGNGRHMVLKSGSIDTSSDLSDQSSSGQRSEFRPRAKQSPLAASPSQSEPEESVSQQPEVHLTLKFKEESSVFIVSIDQVLSLPARQDGSSMDSYVRLFLIPKLADLVQRKTAKTQTQPNNLSPIFNEDIRYDEMSRDELVNSTLHVEVLDYKSNGKHVLLGSNIVQLANVTFVEGEAPMRLTLNPPEIRESLGTVNLSICYSPDTKRLSVIILRAKDLNHGNFKETDPQAKLWVTMSGERFLGKLKTKKKQQSSGPIFNEALTCTVEPSKINGVAVNVAITNEHKQASNKALGQVTLCAQSVGEEFRHWSDVMATPGKHIAEWHELR